MKILAILVGAIAGLLIVRYFMLDPFEEIGWEIFWHEIFNGKGGVSGEGLEVVLKSNTFMKCSIGTIIGAIAGGVINTLLNKKLSFLHKKNGGRFRRFFLRR